MSAWALLGIAPTADVAAIRRAYAGKLKLTRPDEDAEAFQRLVRARDAALGEAAAIADLAPQDEEAHAERGFAPVLALADRVDAASANPRDAAGSAEAPVPSILVSEASEAEAPSASAAPIPRIVVIDETGDTAPASLAAPPEEGFSLEASERHWAEARRLARLLRLMLSRAPVAEAELARLIDGCKALPRGPRHEVEAAVVEATGRDLRLPDARFNRARVDQVRAIFTHGEAVFGWLRDDRLIHGILGPRDAAAFCLIGQEEDYWTSGKRPRLPDGDARVLFARTPKYMRVYERFRRRGRPAWRFDILAFLAPPLWAFYYHQNCLAFVTLGLLTAAGVLMLSADALADPSNLAGAGIFIATCLATAFCADRVVLWGAAWTVGRARKQLRYDPKLRAEFLQRKGQHPREFGMFFIFVMFSSMFLMLPYVAAYARLQQAAAALAALFGG
jgi:hypothetical protein